ncbi:MAG: Argininosuccinate synthase [Planctomycetes bacterium]|nr:Argininosuccinate synthase [Planctomycetota bacterium]
MPEDTVLVAFSGGLDTSWCVAHVRETLRRPVATVTIDTGGFDAAELARIEARAKDLGSARHVTVDGRAAVFDRFVRFLVAGNCLRGGVYPLCVSAERIVQAEETARVAREIGATAVLHGSTGAGNDQVRFDVAFHVLLPGVEVLTPVRELQLSRQQEFDFLAARGFPAKLEAKTYSVNRGLWGTTIGGGDLHRPSRPVPSDCWPDTADPDAAPAGGVTVAIGFERGVPVSLDGRAADGVSLCRRLAEIANPHGVGRGVHTGDTILGIKGRLAFEAPAALVIVTAHRELEKLALTKLQNRWKDQLGAFYADLVHEGLWFDPVRKDVEAFLASSQRVVSGTVTLRLVRGRIEVVSVDTPASLLGRMGAVYGEGSRAWTGEEARAYSKIYGVPSVLAARRDADLDALARGESPDGGKRSR